LLVVRLGGEVAAWVAIKRDATGILAHRATIKRLMVSTEMRGRGIGRTIMHKVHEVARDELGVSLLWLTCRGETDLDAFYSRLGYTEMGRLPRALRIALDDYRDEIFMFVELDRGEK
jgi:GNAT superfamily N-acetyltransferase